MAGPTLPPPLSSAQEMKIASFVATLPAIDSLADNEADMFVNTPECPALFYQAITKHMAASVISSHVTDAGKAKGWGHFRVRKGPLLYPEALTVAVTQFILKELGLTQFEVAMVHMNNDPTIVTPFGTRQNMSKGFFILSPDLALKAGYPLDATFTNATLPSYTYVNTINPASPWNPLKAKMVNKHALSDYTSAANYPQCSAGVFKMILMRILLGFCDFADRNIIVMCGETETATLLDTDIFHKVDLATKLYSVITGYPKQLGVYLAARAFDHLTWFSAWQQWFSSPQCHHLFHHHALKELWGWHANTFSSPTVFLDAVQRRLKDMQCDYGSIFLEAFTNLAIPKAFVNKPWADIIASATTKTQVVTRRRCAELTCVKNVATTDSLGSANVIATTSARKPKRKRQAMESNIADMVDHVPSEPKRTKHTA